MQKTTRELLKSDQKKMKLRLHKETLTLLEDSQLLPAAAGGSASLCDGHTGVFCCQLN